ncbi:hypothetical protein FQN49_004229 [Arthroderma sp. PD_2]|nr:hypothetical protein FQN49_004229 [Arthroderma sp. PD_2]
MAPRAAISPILHMIFIFFQVQLSISAVVGATALRLSSFRGKKAPAGLEYQDLDIFSDDSSKATIDFSSLLQTNPADHSDIFSEALQLLDSMQHAPSCNQRAVASLITSCQVLSSGKSERGQYSASDLDHVKSLYAARLAICEVTGAGAAVPDRCSGILPSRDDELPIYKFKIQPSQKSEQQDVMSGKILAPCLRSLESKPQWWTSYSNSRQNAAVMCHAARFDVEKEELLNHHRILTEVTSGLNSHLNRSLENAYTQATQQREFLRSVDDLRLKLLRNLRKDSVAIQGQLMEFLKGTKDIFRDANGEFQGFVKASLAEAATLSKQIQLSIRSVQEVKQALGEVLVDGVKRNSELVAAEKSALQSNSHLIIDIHRSLYEIKTVGVGSMVEELSHLQASMRSLGETVSSVNQKHTSLDDRMKQFDDAFHNFEQKAAILQNMMVVQIMNQTRLQQSIHEDLRSTQALLQNITNSAIYLQTAIGDAQSVFRTFSLWTGPLASMVWWSWCAVTFCIFTIFKTRAMVYVLLICVCGTALLTSGALDWLKAIEKPSLSAIREATYVEITCFALGLVFSAVAVTMMVVKGYLPLPLRSSKVTAVSSSDMIGLP